jgi:hypothetical protein
MKQKKMSARLAYFFFLCALACVVINRETWCIDKALLASWRATAIASLLTFLRTFLSRRHIYHLIVNDYDTKTCLTLPTLRFLIPLRKPRNQFPIVSLCASSPLTPRKESYESRAPPRRPTLRSWHSPVAASDFNHRQDISKRRGEMFSVTGEYCSFGTVWLLGVQKQLC